MKNCSPFSHLCSFGELGGAVIAAHPQHILGAVIELGEAIELAALELQGGLEDAVQGALPLAGSVEQRPQQLPALLEVAGAAQVQRQPGLLQLLARLPWQARVRDGGVGAEPGLRALQPGDRDRQGSEMSWGQGQSPAMSKCSSRINGISQDPPHPAGNNVKNSFHKSDLNFS